MPIQYIKMQIPDLDNLIEEAWQRFIQMDMIQSIADDIDNPGIMSPHNRKEIRKYAKEYIHRKLSETKELTTTVTVPFAEYIIDESIEDWLKDIRTTGKDSLSFYWERYFEDGDLWDGDFYEQLLNYAMKQDSNFCEKVHEYFNRRLKTRAKEELGVNLK